MFVTPVCNEEKPMTNDETAEALYIIVYDKGVLESSLILFLAFSTALAWAFWAFSAVYEALTSSKILSVNSLAYFPAKTSFFPNSFAY
jgi:hypothetical protein